MIITSNTTGLEALKTRLEMARDMVQTLLEQAVTEAGNQVVQDLSAAAPRGANSDGSSPPGDADGALADSFFVLTEIQASADVAVSVRTSQSVKLGYVVNGRGEVRPVRAKALWWTGLPHPVMYAKPSKPNDFVSPVLSNANSNAEQYLQPVVDELAAILESA